MACTCTPVSSGPDFCATVLPTTTVMVKRQAQGVAAFVTMLDGVQVSLAPALNSYNCTCTPGVVLACAVVNGLVRVMQTDRTDALPFDTYVTLLDLHDLITQLAPPPPPPSSPCP